MGYTEIKERLDKVVKNIKEAESLCDFNSQISFIRPLKRIHVFRGIDIIADSMGLELREENDWGDDLPYKYSFMYEGIEFFQLEQERLASFVSV